MINIDTIRADLAAALDLAALDLAGVEIYTDLPGSLTTPAVVVGLPSAITFEQAYTLGVVELPLTVVTGPMFNSKAETQLMAIALTVAAAVRNVRTAVVLACRFVSIDETTEMAVSDQVPMYSCNVNVQITTRTQE